MNELNPIAAYLYCGYHLSTHLVADKPPSNPLAKALAEALSNVPASGAACLPHDPINAVLAHPVTKNWYDTFAPPTLRLSDGPADHSDPILGAFASLLSVIAAEAAKGEVIPGTQALLAFTCGDKQNARRWNSRHAATVTQLALDNNPTLLAWLIREHPHLADAFLGAPA